MLDLSLLAPTDPPSSTVRAPSDLLYSPMGTANASLVTLAHARRPAILTYTSPLVSTASTLARMPLLVLGWNHEAETLDVPMLEGITFTKGWRNVPDTVRVVVESTERMQFYDVTVKIRARFQGLRWVLYHYRLLSFVVFTTSFFGTSFAAAVIGYAVVAIWLGAREDKSGEGNSTKAKKESETNGWVKREGEVERGRSTTPQALKGSDDGVVVKREDEEMEAALASVQPLGAEADDEDEELGGSSSAWRDSGIGTGREEREGEKASSARRRKSYGS